MNSRDIIKLLRNNGWLCVRTKGSHHQFKYPTKQGLIAVPHPKRDLPIGTARAILQQAGIKRN